MPNRPQALYTTGDSTFQCHLVQVLSKICIVMGGVSGFEVLGHTSGLWPEFLFSVLPVITLLLLSQLNVM